MSTPSRPSRHVTTLTGSSFGSGTLAYTEEDLSLQLAPFGVSRRGFRALRRALGVPGIHTPGGHVLIDHLTLQLAWRAISSLGRPDFVIPSAHAGRDGGIRHGLKSGAMTTSLDLTFYQSNWRIFLSELLVARRISDANTTADLHTSLEEASSRLALSLAQLTASSIEAHRRSMARRVSESGLAPVTDIPPSSASPDPDFPS